MGIMEYFPEYKTSTAIIYSQSPGYNSSGEVVYVDTEIYNGACWFWLGGEGEQFTNQQDKSVGTYSMILDPADVTTTPQENDIATINGVSGYRLGVPAEFFGVCGELFYTLNKKVGV